MMVPDLYKECSELKNEFDVIKKTYIKWINETETADYYKLISKLNNKKVEKILYKLKNFPGDISPNMLLTLSESLEKLKG
jgi:hypothetical protein